MIFAKLCVHFMAIEADMSNRSGKKLWVEIPQELYETLEYNAKKRNITFTKYINRILLRYSIKEESYENNEE